MKSNFVFYEAFQVKINSKQSEKNLKNLLKKKTQLLQSLKKNYKYSFNNKLIQNAKKYKLLRIVGMGGSSLGAKAIYDFLRKKIKKNFYFFDNLQKYPKTKKKHLNLIISKSGNTLETIINFNINTNKHDQNILITENKENSLKYIFEKTKSEIIEHPNFIGGRYSVLSEVGMLPAKLMGLNINKFKRINSIIKDKKFTNFLLKNVNQIHYFQKNKKFNSVILNYDQDLTSLLKWYQQLVSESLGKNQKGIFPIISDMPRDNHSLMQYFLDGPKNNFYTLFGSKDICPKVIDIKKLPKQFSFLKKKKIDDIIHSTFNSTRNIFYKKRIPYRSFVIRKKSEETLGELFTYFILETILVAKLSKVNPFDQPAVELIKKETKKILETP